jgi:hypothetical protein
MGTLVGFLPALTCGGGMVLCMWWMSRGRRSPGSQDPAVDNHDPVGRDAEVAELRGELDRLRAEVRARDLPTVSGQDR